MKDAHRELVDKAVAAYSDHDPERLVELCHPDVELFPLRSLLDGSPFCGHEGVREFMREIVEEWDELRIEPEGIRDLDGDRLLILGHFHARGRASGVVLDAPAAWLVEIRDDKVSLLRAFSDPADALRDLGLEP